MLSLKNKSFKYGYFAREDVVLYKTLEKKILKYLFKRVKFFSSQIKT